MRSNVSATRFLRYAGYALGFAILAAIVIFIALLVIINMYFSEDVQLREFVDEMEYKSGYEISYSSGDLSIFPAVQLDMKDVVGVSGSGERVSTSFRLDEVHVNYDLINGVLGSDEKISFLLDGTVEYSNFDVFEEKIRGYIQRSKNVDRLSREQLDYFEFLVDLRVLISDGAGNVEVSEDIFLGEVVSGDVKRVLSHAKTEQQGSTQSSSSEPGEKIGLIVISEGVAFITNCDLNRCSLVPLFSSDEERTSVEIRHLDEIIGTYRTNFGGSNGGVLERISSISGGAKRSVEFRTCGAAALLFHNEDRGCLSDQRSLEQSTADRGGAWLPAWVRVITHPVFLIFGSIFVLVRLLSGISTSRDLSARENRIVFTIAVILSVTLVFALSVADMLAESVDRGFTQKGFLLFFSAVQTVAFSMIAWLFLVVDPLKFRRIGRFGIDLDRIANYVPILGRLLPSGLLYHPVINPRYRARFVKLTMKLLGIFMLTSVLIILMGAFLGTETIVIGASIAYYILYALVLAAIFYIVRCYYLIQKYKATYIQDQKEHREMHPFEAVELRGE